MLKFSALLLLLLTLQQVRAQVTPKDTLVDLGYGLYETLDIKTFEAIKIQNIFCINYLYNNDIAFTEPHYISTNKKCSNKDFEFSKSSLAIFGSKTLKVPLDSGTELDGYYTFTHNGAFYQYFVFLHINAGGNINKLYTGLLVKDKEQFIALPDKISSTNPHILFFGKGNKELLPDSIYCVDFQADYSNKVTLHVLQNNAFVQDSRYFLTLESNENYPYQIGIANSHWFVDWKLNKR